MHESFVTNKSQEIVERGESIENPYVDLAMLEEFCKKDEILSELFVDMRKMSEKYAETVFKFEQIVLEGNSFGSSSMEDRKEIDKIRSGTHDATIDSINILAREIKKRGGDSSWINKVSASGRSGYGKFALTTAFEYAINDLEQITA